MTISVKEKEQLGKLAQKNTFILLVLTALFTPVFGYFYTGKYCKSFFILFAAFSLELWTFSNADYIINIGFNGWLYVALSFYIVSLIDNYSAINTARNKLINNSLETDYYNQNNSDYSGLFDNKFDENIQIKLLKLVQKKREVTLGDCVLETGISSQKIRPILDKMVKDELIAVSNRSGDSAVVYRWL
ncbi:MAG: hypothetical protein ACRCU2_09335 [Planktothrix sp.]